MANTIKSLNSVKSFMKEKNLEYGDTNTLNVLVEDVINLEVPVLINIYDINSYNINIMWEDKGIEYRSLNLFGSYSTNFNEMDFIDGSLIIIDSNYQKIIVS